LIGMNGSPLYTLLLRQKVLVQSWN
jgi:hypothetical protein